MNSAEMKREQAQKGFTLLEVLVAMVILSVSLLAAIKVVTEVTRSASYMQDKTIAQWVAMNKIAEMRLAKGLPGDGRSEGEEEMAGRNWKWKINFKKTAYPAVREAEVEVRQGNESKDDPATIVLRCLIGSV